MKPDWDSPSETADPLDDYEQVSEKAMKRRLDISFLLGTLLGLCLMVFMWVTEGYMQDSDPSGFPVLSLFFGILICIIYLGLVRNDAGNWSLVHPRIANGFRKLLKQKYFFTALVIIDLVFAFIVVYPQWSGMKEYNHGWLNAAVMLGAMVVINLLALAWGGGNDLTDE